MRLFNTKKLPKSGKYVVAFSAGADSLALLHYMVKQRYQVRAVHVNHGETARTSGSKLIQMWCENIASELGVSLDVLSIDVESLKKNVKEKGTEAVERNLRYSALASNLKEGEILLTGHHANDNLETILMRVGRGTGIQGLTGINRETTLYGAKIIRPLLELPKSEILDYCNKHELSWHDDKENYNLEATRSFIRHKIVPEMEHLYPQVYKAIETLTSNALEADELLSDLAQMDLKICMLEPGVFSVKAVKALSVTRFKNMLRIYYNAETGTQLTSNALEEIVKLVGGSELTKTSKAYKVASNTKLVVNCEQFKLEV